MRIQEQRAGPAVSRITVAVPGKYKPRYTLKQRIDCLDCMYFKRKECCCILGEENCILINELQASDKPKNCKYCYWWNPGTRSCRRDVIGGCAYEISEHKSDHEETMLPCNPPSDPCRTCPYSRDHSGEPCVSFCLKNVLEEWMAERRALQM